MRPLSCAHDLLDGRVGGKFDVAVFRQVVQYLQEIQCKGTGVAQLTRLFQQIASTKTLASARFPIDDRRLVHQGGRQIHQHFGILRIRLYELFQQRKGFQPLALLKQLCGSPPFGLIRGIGRSLTPQCRRYADARKHEG
jgi:hypothetical protein